MDELLPMRLFVKVAELRSFARAATELNISNSSATRLVMSIEDRLGARLLNRTTRSLSLTDAGHLYLAQIRHVIDEIDRVEETIASMHHEPIGSLKIAAPVMFGMHVLAPAIVPEVTIVDRHVDLVSEGFDVGLLLSQHISNNTLVKRPLTRLKQIVCAAPHYVDRHGAPAHPHDLASHACLSFHADFMGEYLSFDHDQTRITVRPNKSASSNNVGLIRNWALSGMGIAVLPDFLVQSDLDDGQLLALLPGYRLETLEMNVAYPSRRHFPRKARLFVDHLIDHFVG
ncbi:LysR family transcriptional regulator [Burkholderia cenocepacia]|uniref:LysR family transcriptional regulator n=1 Tax=Burkholderia cenocepacia TaxID=95486 RepID=UPI002B2408B1|nr:LysR family transcriptional regulator [Burkholderia cenocepacia]MEB2495743.1 LysR family transcriptional regulator [Burkholderia cenocepacia]MEB2553212.1 LysR family transcriptional regulator [Burkholderia cenocepacia]